MGKYVFWIVMLIALYIVADKYLGFSSVLSSLGTQAWKGVATLQGRDVKGVTT